MSSRAVLKLMGVPTLVGADGCTSIVFTAERPFQVLVYLAVRQNWVRRDEIAALLWPDRDGAQARNNLRKVLLLAKRVSGVGTIEQHADLLRWTPETDLMRLERACVEARFEEAAALVSAPLMQGLEHALAGDGGNWVLFERRRIEERWNALCRQQLKAWAEDPERLCALAEKMVAADATDETAVCAWAAALSELGHREKAIEVLERHATHLRETLSVESSAKWQSLRRSLDEIRQQALASSPKSKVWTTEAPSFVGRRSELAQVRRLLDEPGCRVLTVTGFAGLGKSAIARQATQTLADAGFDTIAWIALEDLTHCSEVPARIARAINLPLNNADDPWETVGEALANRNALLVFDNAEHLELRDPLERLLGSCQAVRLLVTSRERLGIAGEWLLPLDALPVPDEGEADVEVLRHYDAVRLFELRARPFAPDFDLARQAGAVARLVQAVGGSPLAIELAASWVRLMPVDAIAADLEQSPQLLETGSPNERGLRAGFEQTWQRLGESEREAAARLALLPGDFGRAMAERVAQVPLPLLAILVDRSLLRSDSTSGRFSMHPLIKQWAARRARQPQSLRAAHSDFVVHWLGRYADPLQPLPRQVHAEIDQELAHVRAAWRYLVDTQDARGLQAVTRGFGLYCETRGLWAEGVAALKAAADALAVEPGGGFNHTARQALAVVRRSLATLQYRGGLLLPAETTGRALLKVARSVGDRVSLRSGLNIVGLSLWQRGQFDDARPYFVQGLRLALQDSDQLGASIFTSNLAMVDKARGQYDVALAGYRSKLDIDRALGKVDGVVSALNNMANVFRVQQRYAEALTCLDEAMGLCNQEGLASTRPFVHVNIGLTHLDAGRHDDAAPSLGRALDEAHSHGEPMIEAAALLALAQLDLHRGRPTDADARVEAALCIARRLPSLALQAQCVFACGEIELALGRQEQGAALMRWSLCQPALNRADHDMMQRRMARLGVPTSTDPAGAETTADQVLARYRA